MTKDDRFCALILLGIAIATCLGSARHVVGTFNDPGPGFFPMVLGIVLGLLSFIILAGGIVAKRADPGQESAERCGRGRVSREALYVVASLVVFGFALVPLGYILTTLVVFAVLLRLVARLTWPMVVGGAAALALGSYLIFVTLLGVTLPQGLLGF